MAEAFARSGKGARPVWFVTKDTWLERAAQLPPTARAFAEGTGFTGAAGQIVTCPDESGR